MKLVLHVEMEDPKNKQALSKAIYRKWNKAVERTANVLSRRLPSLLISGGGGGQVTFRSFMSTALWQYLNTPQAWGELGFPSLQPLDDLIDVLHNSMRFVGTRQSPKSLLIQLVDIEIVAKFTEHPAAGQGQLPVGISWFVDWVVKGMPVSGYRFKKFDVNANRALQKHARSFPIADEEAGIMVPNGMWQIPPVFRVAIDDWLMSNVVAIKRFIEQMLRKTIRQV